MAEKSRDKKRGRKGYITITVTREIVSKMCFRLAEMQRVVGCQQLLADELR